MTIYFIIGFAALIILYKIFEERGSSWAFLYCVGVFAAVGFYFNKFLPMYNQGIIQFLVELFLFLIIIFIYNKFMYFLFNTMSVAVIFIVSAAGCSYLFQIGIVKLYPIVLDYVLNFVYSIL